MMPPKPDPKVAEPSAAAGYAEAVERAVEVCASSDVAASFEEFNGVNDEAARMEVAPPGIQVRRTAERILTALTQEFPRYYMVFPDEDGEIAIETIGQAGRVLVVCDNSGVACFTTISGEDGYNRYDQKSAENFPDGFIRSALKKIK